MKPTLRLLATRLVDGRGERVFIDAAPVAVVSRLEAILGGWWLRSGGYPVGRCFGWCAERHDG